MRLWKVAEDDILPQVLRRDPSTSRLLTEVGEQLRRVELEHPSIPVIDIQRQLEASDDAIALALGRFRDPHLQRQLTALDAATNDALHAATAARSRGDITGASTNLARAAHDQLQAAAARMETLGGLATLTGSRRDPVRVIMFDVDASDRAVVVATAAVRNASRLLSDATRGVDDSSRFSVALNQARHGVEELSTSHGWKDSPAGRTSARSELARGFVARSDTGEFLDEMRHKQPHLWPSRIDNPKFAVAAALGLEPAFIDPLPKLPRGRKEVREFARTLESWGRDVGIPYRAAAQQIEPLIDGSTRDLRSTTSTVDSVIEQLRRSKEHLDEADQLTLDGM